jgi:hypothetical protein
MQDLTELIVNLIQDLSSGNGFIRFIVIMVKLPVCILVEKKNREDLRWTSQETFLEFWPTGHTV